MVILENIGLCYWEVVLDFVKIYVVGNLVNCGIQEVQLVSNCIYGEYFVEELVWLNVDGNYYYDVVDGKIKFIFVIVLKMVLVDFSL